MRLDKKLGYTEGTSCFFFFSCAVCRLFTALSLKPSFIKLPPSFFFSQNSWKAPNEHNKHNTLPNRGRQRTDRKIFLYRAINRNSLSALTEMFGKGTPNPDSANLPWAIELNPEPDFFFLCRILLSFWWTKVLLLLLISSMPKEKMKKKCKEHA